MKRSACLCRGCHYSLQSSCRDDPVSIPEWPIRSAVWNPPKRGANPENERSIPLPAVSVIVPVHNSRRTLIWLLRALSAQSYPAELMEVVIADDGSDETYGDLIEDDWPWRI